MGSCTPAQLHIRNYLHRLKPDSGNCQSNTHCAVLYTHSAQLIAGRRGNPNFVILAYSIHNVESNEHGF